MHLYDCFQGSDCTLTKYAYCKTILSSFFRRSFCRLLTCFNVRMWKLRSVKVSPRLLWSKLSKKWYIMLTDLFSKCVLSLKIREVSVFNDRMTKNKELLYHKKDILINELWDQMNISEWSVDACLRYYISLWNCWSICYFVILWWITYGITVHSFVGIIRFKFWVSDFKWTTWGYPEVRGQM